MSDKDRKLPPGVDRLPSGKYRARFTHDGVQHSDVFDTITAAKNWRTTTKGELLTDTYIDPRKGAQHFEQYAREWAAAQPWSRGTREQTESRLRVHVLPTFGASALNAIRPSAVQAWLNGLRDELSASTAALVFGHFSAIMTAAVDDELIRKNPAKAASVKPPRREPRRVVPWEHSRVLAVHDAFPGQYRIAVRLGAGLGLRQGEVFGLAPTDVDFLRGIVTVQRQIKIVGGSLVFGLPKYEKVRTVPLPDSVRDALAAHLALHPARTVELPWIDDKGKTETRAAVPLVLSTRESTALNRHYFNTHLWKPALRSVGVEPTRANGTHALRHHYASVLLDKGETIKAVSEYLGHADAGFTLRTYTHLMPSSAERTRAAIDASWDRVVTELSQGDESAAK